MHMPFDEAGQQQPSRTVARRFCLVARADAYYDPVFDGDVARLIFHRAEIRESRVFEEQVAGLFAKRAF